VKAIVERPLCENEKGSTVEVEARCDTDAVLEEIGLLKPELLDLTSKVVNLRRNSMFLSPRTKSKCKGKVEEAEKEVSAVPKEKASAEGDSKVTILKNSLARMFSRKSGSTAVGATRSSNKEGIKDQSCERTRDGLKKEESLDEKTKVKKFKKRLSFKAIKSRFTLEKKEEAEATPDSYI
jgi:hypothetical protein